MKLTGNKKLDNIKIKALSNSVTLRCIAKQLNLNYAYFLQILNELTPTPKGFIDKVETAFKELESD